ncbi:FAD/NAD(P)-binding domain-containing protein [Aspergillus heteromorphus CBS 117.55]|uniref:FAD/NAD(P)-binding domain-containing protein n=1 Tax=Aspergillus heteromorphus CBS 117.55 TaxID=1448321 RepID=A0A317VL27_9EURO|nr:FAD/NAD(P)-binding domain-containing protein [Aspergillus heteromorphus CBS 117.55]PWY75094.1 FAD/NAD(P)-binding domain-containing protein [Aspergillus heteromorphus CBS 117.55]
MRSFLSGAVALSCALGAAASSYNTSAYSDSVTGIDFQRWCDDDTGFCFGVALPEEAGTDFIGQMNVPLSSSKGWGGVSMSGSMTNVLLIAAWPNGDSVVGTLREAESYVSPAVYTGDAVLENIPSGTSINSTYLTYTFLCSGCVVGQPTTWAANETAYYFGWALSATNPTTPSSSSSKMPYHAAGYGGFEAELYAARSSEFSTWASKAVVSNTTTTASASASATPSASVVPTVANTTYDYIVVGGGAAGIIAAERLAETKKSVLLIERGPASTVQTGATDALTWNSSITGYDVPALGSVLESVGLEDEYLCDDTAGMAGCVLGGGTIVNAMSFIYPQERDFDDKWPTGWKWTDVKAAAERFYSRNPGSTLPSKDGKRYDQGMYTVLSSFLEGLGWTHVNSQEQPNEKHNVYSYPSWDVDNGIRAGPVRSYLPLVEDDDNFTLRLNANVLRLVRRGGRITGVEVQSESGAEQIINVRAGGKVILAAGSLSTPRILFNSGIGPTEQIETVKSGSTGITLPPSAEWIDLPVGENLRDHPMFTITVDTNSNFTHFNTSSVIPGSDATAVKMFDEGSGVMTQGGHRLQFWTSNVGTDGKTRFYQGSCSTTTDGVITMKLYLTHGATSSGVLGIESTGATVVSTDPWLQTAADKEATTRFLEGLLTDMKNSTGGFTVSGSATTASAILDAYTSGDHYVGTAKMGLDDGRERNGTSVVDLNTKVYGTENLYVVDASIHPDLPTGNTQAIVQIAAEAAIARIIAQGTTVSSASVSVPAASTKIAAATSVKAVGADSATATVTSVEATATVGTITTAQGSGSDSSSSESSSGSSSSSSSSDEGEGEGDDDDEYDCSDYDDEYDDYPETTEAVKVAEATTAGSVAAVTAYADSEAASTTTIWVTSTDWTTTTDVVVATSTQYVTVWPTFS